MGIKFNCSNPDCRRRIEVDESMAGASVQCPNCSAALQVPASQNIRFTCTNPECRQHIVVDVSEAGRYARCPSCGKTLRVPGDPPKPLIRPPPEPKSREDKELAAALSAASSIQSRFAPLKKLLLAWSAGAALMGIFSLAAYYSTRSVIPPHLNAIADEIYSPHGTNMVVKPRFNVAVVPVELSTTNANSERFDYYLVPPARMEPHRKYPVLVDQTSSGKHDHIRDIQFLANAGIFYVSPNSLNITKWGTVPELQNTLAVYNDLLKNPNIDPKRIYISGQSITTVAACVVFENNPSLWRGLVLFEPVHYPKIPEESKNYPSVFISMGLADRYNRGGTGPGEGEKFLQEACRHLVPVRIDYQPGDHGYQPEQLRRAYLSLTKFILTDY